MKIKRRKPRIPKETKLRVVTDYRGGIKINDIATRHKVSRMTVYAILKQAEEGLLN